MVLYLPLYPDGGCRNRELYRPQVRSFEAEYWGRIDFLYLNKENEEVQPVLILAQHVEPAAGASRPSG